MSLYSLQETMPLSFIKDKDYELRFIYKTSRMVFRIFVGAGFPRPGCGNRALTIRRLVKYINPYDFAQLARNNAAVLYKGQGLTI